MRVTVRDNGGRHWGTTTGDNPGDARPGARRCPRRSSTAPVQRLPDKVDNVGAACAQPGHGAVESRLPTARPNPLACRSAPSSLWTAEKGQNRIGKSPPSHPVAPTCRHRLTDPLTPWSEGRSLVAGLTAGAPEGPKSLRFASDRLRTITKALPVPRCDSYTGRYEARPDPRHYGNEHRVRRRYRRRAGLPAGCPAQAAPECARRLLFASD